MKNTVIFDLDGTLVNSIPFHFRIHKKVFKKFGVDLSKEYFEKYCNGTEPHEFYGRILQHYLGSCELLDKAWNEQKKYKMYSGLQTIKTYPGVKTLLKSLKKKNYKMAVASSSHLDYVNKILSYNNITDYFEHIVGSDHVKESKPNPAIFLQARKMVNTPKKECIIIEDSINGAIAAKRAGIDVICVLTSEKKEDIPNYAKTAKKHSDLLKMIEKM